MLKVLPDLKSNMDRFIVEPFCQTFALNVYLKSNMDRFIAFVNGLSGWLQTNLKSNMDRFIGSAIWNTPFLM